ncbi:hypothetical protein P7C70_g280, partial [Phenoliferia sp. Uapishka_3]
MSDSINGSSAAPVVQATAPLSAAQRMAQQHSANGAQSSSAQASTSSDAFPALGGGNAKADLITVDPFPPAATSFDTPASIAPAKPKPINISDESAFPSLGGNLGAKKAGPSWGAGGGAAQRIRDATPTPSSNGNSRSATPVGDESTGTATPNSYSTRVQLPAHGIHIHAAPSAGGRARGVFSNAREIEPTTLGEVMTLLMRRHPSVTIEASTSKNITTFLIKAKGAEAQAAVETVKRELLGRLAKKVSIDVLIPAGLRALVIGGKGRTLKQITDATGAQIQIPPRDPNADADLELPTDEFPDGPLIPITISGDSHAVEAARQKVLSIVNERIAKVQTKLDSVPKIYWPLLSGARGARMAELVASVGATDVVSVYVPRAFEKRGVSATAGDEEEKEVVEKAIVISGERDAVAKVVEAIQTQVAELTDPQLRMKERTCKTISMSVSKRQHRFLVGANADEILEVTGCSVELPSVESASEDVTIRGPQAALIKALEVVLAKAQATPVDTLDLSTAHRGSHDKMAYAANVTRYILRKGRFRQLSDDNDVQVYLPRPAAIAAGTPTIEIVGKDVENVKAARTAIIAVVRTLPPTNFAIVDVDSLIHKHLIGKKGSKVKAFEEKRGVEVIFPPDGEDRSDILLVFTGESSKAIEVLTEVKAEIEQMAKEAADITTSTLTIPQALHRNIIGQGGTTLNAVIGEERLVNVSFGSKAPVNGEAKTNGAGAEDVVTIRGPSDEVARVKREISRIAEEAKNSEIINSHVIEFEVDTLHVRHLVGKAGSGINKLREDLGVRVDFEELGAASTSTKKSSAKSKVTIKGRKENAEEAKKRILHQVDRLADEVTLTVPIPASLERGTLIGKQGAYMKRLETNYDVRINFPKAGDSSNDITIRGGQKGASAAKKELVDLIDFSKEHGQVVTFTVSVKSLPRVLGKAGATINEIKEDNQVTVDIDQASDDAITAEVTLRGTKAGTQAAKAAILAIAKDVDGEARLTLDIPREFHTTLIGSGGSSIRDLITRCGGPTEARLSGNAVRFPRQGDESNGNTVTITATKDVAEKIRAALEKEVASLKSRVVYGVAVPRTLHASVIGKGASALQELQRKHGVKVMMPGWNDYAQTGEVVNPEDVKDAPVDDIIKLVGPREACLAAADDLTKGRGNQISASHTIQVPRKLHAKIANGGRFFRSLPNGTRVTHEGVKPPPSSVKGKKPPTPTNGAAAPAARIDDDGDAAPDTEVLFQLVPLYEDAQEETGDIPWVIESASQEDADKILADIERQLKQATSSTHVGWVTVPRGLMPRIVGRGGAGLDRLRTGGVEVEVVGRKDANQLTLTGTPDAIEAAHQVILGLAAPRPPRQQYNRERDDY